MSEIQEVIETPDGKRVVPMPVLKQQDRLTGVFTVNYEHFGYNPTSVGPIISCAMLETNGEEPFRRQVKIGEDWVDLLEHAKCWMPADKVGYLVLENRSGKGRSVYPTKSEADAIKSMILEVGYDPDGAWLTPPGFPFIGYPKEARRVIARCQLGIAACYLTVFPK